MFEGEQHGFRKADNIKRALDAEFYFYSRVFGFEPAEEIEAVEIWGIEKEESIAPEVDRINTELSGDN